MPNKHSGAEIEGDIIFTGTGAGLCFAEIYAHAVAVDLTSVAQNDWDQVVAFDTNGESNNATPDHANDHITITKAGKYLVSFFWCGHTTGVPHTWDFHISKNNNGVAFPNLTTHITTAVAGRLTHAGASAILDLALNDTIELWVQRLSAGGNIVLTTDNCVITIVQIGR